MNSVKLNIIGLSGSYASGKDTVANYLQAKEFKHISLSDILRQELKLMGKTVSRKNLQWLGNKIRTEQGSGSLAWKALLNLEKGYTYIISSIGTLGEIEVLKNNSNFKLIFVDAPLKTRFERLAKRKRENDPKTFEDFQKAELLESKGGNANFRAHDLVRKKADIILINDKTLDDLQDKIELIIKNLKLKPYWRPSWDEYFFSIMKVVSSRATCGRGRTGCVFVKDKQILVTGYVGSPPGQPHCDDVGHLMEITEHHDGIARPHCVRTTHAEQNALMQAAKKGISIEGATLYIKMEPCPVCARLLVTANIKEVICEYKYHAGQESREIFKRAGVKIKYLYDEDLKY